MKSHQIKQIILQSRLFIAFLLFAAYIGFNCSGPVEMTPDDYASIQQGFVIPHDTNVVWCYYYWMNDDISLEGVTKDLEAMKEFGIGGLFVGNINRVGETGPVPLFSDMWWEITVHTVNEAHRLGLEVGFFNCPGWSQSGGPWVSSEQAMRHTVYSELSVEGGKLVQVHLDRPADEFQDTYVLAFPRIEAEEQLLTNANARISVTPAVVNPGHLLDGNTETSALFEIVSGHSYDITIQADEAITVRSLLLYPAEVPFRCHVEVQAKNNGEFITIHEFDFDRSNFMVNVGPVIYGPVAVAIPETVSEEFRLVISQMHSPQHRAGFSLVELKGAQVFEHFIEKTLGKMHPTPLPAFDSYLWETQPAVDESLLVGEVLNISQYMDEDGMLNWDAPEGQYTVLRMGMTPTGTRNSPASPLGAGYEIDKASAEIARFHFEQFIGEILSRIPEESLPAFKYVIADSYEMGPQNWTDGFAERFQETFGYDPVRFLPVFSGRIVGSAEESERFLWDLRRGMADDIAYEYVGGLRQVSNEHNLKLWLENYGHWGFPAEFLMYGGQSDLVAGEYWNEGHLGDIECKAASSAAHIYGKSLVSAEAYTSGWHAYRRHPATLKRRGDWSLTEGINHHVMHVYIQQPDDARIPGINEEFGTEFNRHNTWFDLGTAWIDYLRRCQQLLQKGRYVADVCYFIGEDVPKMTGTTDPELPSGYSYDFINAEVIVNDMFVENGRLMLPHGTNYGLMVLPQLETMRPEVLAKLEILVNQGGAILGPKPSQSPSLQNFPQSDELVKELAGKMWDGTYVDGKMVYRHGNGYVMDGLDVQEAMDLLGIAPDLDLGADVPVLWTHRSLPGMDIYFLTNQGDEVIELRPSFRIEGKKPQLWDAVTGEIRQLNEYSVEDGSIIVPLKMHPLQSWFVVFTSQTNETTAKGFAKNFPERQTIARINNGWTVDFLNKDIGPAAPISMSELFDWTTSDNEQIRYYSGTAVYRTTFTMEDIPEEGRFLLNLGKVGVMARATLNGQQIGTTWIAPFLIPVGDWLNEGENTLELEVVNTWRNRLAKDASLPEEQRHTWVFYSDVRVGEDLEPAGLMGPVTIEWMR
jgi:hypothetical protein